MTIDIKYLESLLERVTPGEWSVGERKARGWSDSGDFFICVGDPTEYAPELICRPYATNGYDGIAERNANAELMAMSKTLARRVMAAEKLAGALRRAEINMAIASVALSTVADTKKVNKDLHDAVDNARKAISEWEKEQ